ncbi:hypothetical protein PoB_005451500 [Plakobranchus ocellatus]|uniref:Uncharacterized protein n=1 Tax=Plakobranchus ocellatus TaxID=259542 RepID=A0AAV4C8L1_9GAST|nr:hypothetical protein PoB_005451500 [Plakobranchus ocellatus]
MPDTAVQTEAVVEQSPSVSSSTWGDELRALPIATSTASKPKKVMKDCVTSPAFNQDKLFSSSLEISPTQPLSEEEQLNSHFVRRQLSNSKSEVITIHVRREDNPFY